VQFAVMLTAEEIERFHNEVESLRFDVQRLTENLALALGTVADRDRTVAALDSTIEKLRAALAEKRVGETPPAYVQPIRWLKLELYAKRRVGLILGGDALVGDLIQMTEQGLLRHKNVGRGTLRDIRAALERVGLNLSTKIEHWPDIKRAARAAALGPLAYEVDEAHLVAAGAYACATTFSEDN